MVYRVIGLMSGSSLDGLDLAFVEFHEVSGKWNFSIKAAACYPYPLEWQQQLHNATALHSRDYQLLHADYGHYLGQCVNRFIEEKGLQFQVQLIASHGHTTFHMPERKMTAQIGDGAAIAAVTGINTVSDLRAMDIALGGQGAPIVPIGEKLLFGEYGFLLNLGGIANITAQIKEPRRAFDICPVNRVLNMLAETTGTAFDAGGAMARSGTVDNALLTELNGLAYYRQMPPKSLANEFGTTVVYPLIAAHGLRVKDALCTYTAHVARQVRDAIKLSGETPFPYGTTMLITGGGAHNTFLIERIREEVQPLGINVELPDSEVVDYKEALIMALIGVLRWREENNVLASVTGASRSSVGGAFWMGGS